MPNRIYVALFAGFYPAIFFLSNNWHMFSFQQNLTLLIGTSLVSIAILLTISYTVNYIVQILHKRVYRTDNKNTPSIQSSFYDPILSFFSLLLCIYLLRNTLDSIDIQSTILYVLIAIVAFLFTLHAYKKGVVSLLTFLVILSSLSILSLSISVFTKTKVPIEDWVIKNKDVYDQIKFQKKPNVYLIITESYSNRSALEAVYNFDNALFYEKMGEFGISINHNYFSNYNHTMASLPSLFGMEHHKGLINIINFDSLGGRRMLEGKTYNPVIDIFRANNYKIQYLHNTGGLIPNGADVDFCYPTPTLLHGLAMFLTHQKIMEPTMFSSQDSGSIASIKSLISLTSLEGEPYFNFIYLDIPGHSPRRINDISREAINKKLEEFRNTYAEVMRSANQELIELIKYIIDQDKNSIIIIIGDHGSWGFRYKEDGQGVEISNELFILDRFGVLAGIRGPDPLLGLMEDGTIKSHVNLFRYIFAYLSGDGNIFITKAPDDSYENSYIMAIKDGEILENFIDMKPQPEE